MSEPARVRHFYVDVAGDPTLFNARGRVIAGTDGCSSHFILGALDVADPAALNARLGELHRQVRDDPYYAGVQSLRPERRKTAILFHAKDDLPEIRERVFRVLAEMDVGFYAVVRDKHGLATDVRNKNVISETYRYTPNRLYDELVRRLFRDCLHKADAHRVCFARRGSRDRTAALRQALDQAKENFQQKWKIKSTAPVEVSALGSPESYCLQAADYFLWAVYRVYTQGEERYLRFLWPRVKLVHDVDDRRKSPAGRYYRGKDALSAESIEKRPGI